MQREKGGGDHHCILITIGYKKTLHEQQQDKQYIFFYDKPAKTNKLICPRVGPSQFIRQSHNSHFGSHSPLFFEITTNHGRRTFGRSFHWPFFVSTRTSTPTQRKTTNSTHTHNQASEYTSGAHMIRDMCKCTKKRMFLSLSFWSLFCSFTCVLSSLARSASFYCLQKLTLRPNLTLVIIQEP